jgi:hypothetical protein
LTWALGLASLAGSLQAEWIQTETFTQDPAGTGWFTHGDRSLFQWSTSAQRLDVTWDSSRPNSYFYLSLPTVLAKGDEFGAAFDLELAEVKAGVHPDKPFAFELAIGFFNTEQAVQPGFLRGTGQNSPNLVELDYFPDTGFGATLWPMVVASNGVFNYNGDDDYTLLELTTNATYHVELAFTPTEQILHLRITRDGMEVGPVKSVRLRPDFTDFRLNAFGILSYSDQGAGGSIQARGRIDNVHVRLPYPPIQNLRLIEVPSAQSVRIQTQRYWRYQLERSADLHAWTPVLDPVEGDGNPLSLHDPSPPPGHAFYRVRAERE